VAPGHKVKQACVICRLRAVLCFAGLYDSAEHNSEEMFVHHPRLIAATYAGCTHAKSCCVTGPHACSGWTIGDCLRCRRPRQRRRLCGTR
jgi:hypothetical protein